MFAALNCFCISAIFNHCSSTVPNQCVGGNNQTFLSDMRHKSLFQRSDIGFVAIEPEAKRIAASSDDDLRDGQGEGRASHFRAKKRLHPGAVAGRRHRGAGMGDVAGLAWQILLKKQRTFRHHLPIVGATRAIKINSASKNGNLSFAVFPVPIVSSLW
jgi:hypothetical protein